MTNSPISQAIHHLRGVVLREGALPTDGQLLESFVRSREADALAMLVQRHGAMVWGVCRRMLFNHHDAEDAFQATFLVLVRRASSVKPREMVGNWLYGVARQTALKARAASVRRHARERQAVHMPETAVTPTEPADDLHKLLDEELARLPDKYRSAVVLCELEGRSLKDAAQQFGLPEGTVASRLARGRTMLAKRLARHGLPVGGAALLPLQDASANVPAAVLSGTIHVCSLLAAGQATTAVSAKTAALVDGIVKGMFLAKLAKMSAGLVLLIACCGIGWVACSGGGAGQVGAQGEAVERQPAQVGKAPARPDKGRHPLFGAWDVVTIGSTGDKIRWLADAEELVFTEEAMFRNVRLPRRVIVVGRDGRTSILDFALIPSTNPPAIDFKITGQVSGPPESGDKVTGQPEGGEEVFQGIYRLDGDRLQICVSGKLKADRPADFDPKQGEGDHRTVIVLQRVRERGASTKSNLKLDDLLGHWVAHKAHGYGSELLPISPVGLIFETWGGTITFEEKRAIMEPGDNAPQKVFDLTFDPNHRPPRLTLTGKGYTYRFIIDLQGDKLRLCSYLRGGANDWPATFEAEEGRNQKFWQLDVLRRLHGKTKEERMREANAIRAREMLQGAWDLVEAEERGVPLRQKTIKEKAVVLTIEDDRITVTEAKEALPLTGRLTVDPGKKPAWMDWTDLRVKAGESPRDPRKGIYLFSSDDPNKPTLRICLAPERPTEFKTIADLNLDQRMYVFQRRPPEGSGSPGTLRPVPGKAPDGKAPVTTFDVRQRRFTDADVGTLNADVEVLLMRGRLGYGSNTVTDEGIKHLVGYTKLRILAAGGLELTDRALESIGQLVAIEELSLDSNKITGEGLRHLAGLKKLRRLDLNFNPLRPAGFEALTALSLLTSLSLYGTGSLDDRTLELLSGLTHLKKLDLPEDTSAVSDRGLAHLAKLEQLENLALFRSTHITDAGLANLGRLKRLQSLRLSDLRSVTPAGLNVLAKLTDLRSLQIDGIRMDEASIRAIAKLTKLEDLMLWYVSNGQDSVPLESIGALRSLRTFRTNLPVSSSAIRELARLPQLESITDELSEVSDEDLTHLARLPKLKKIILASDKVTAASLPTLAKMKSLRELYVTEKVGITPEQWTQLGRDDLPQCRIARFRPPYTVYHQPGR